MEKQDKMKTENPLKSIRQMRNRFNENLKRRLEKLSPEARLKTVLLALLIYAGLTLFTVIRTFHNDNHPMQIKHIESAPIIDSPGYSSGENHFKEEENNAENTVK